MDMRVDSSAAQVDDWLPRIHKVVSLADTSVAKLHGHDYWNDHARVFDDDGNETGWIEDRGGASSDGWIEGENLNGANEHPYNVCPLPDPRLHRVDCTRPSSATLLSDASCGIDVENKVSDGHAKQITIKREPEDIDLECFAQSFNALPHGDNFTEERDITIKKEAVDGDYVFPKKMMNVTKMGSDSVCDGMVQAQSKFIHPPVLNPAIKLEPACNEPTEHFDQTPGFDHRIKSEPDEPTISHKTDKSHPPELTGESCHKQPLPSGRKLRVSVGFKCAENPPELKDKKLVLKSPVQSEADSLSSPCKPQSPPEAPPQTAKYSSVDDYVEWLADYISKGNKSNIVLKGPTNLISDVTKKVNEKIKLAKKMQSSAKESSEMHVQDPKANSSVNSPVSSTSDAPSTKWTFNGIQPNNRGLHFTDINQRPLLSSEESNATTNDSHVTNALPNSSVRGPMTLLPHTVWSVPTVFIDERNHLSATNQRKITRNISKAKGDSKLSPLSRSEREPKVPLPFSSPVPKCIAVRRSGRERKITRPYSPPPIKPKRSFTPAKAPAVVIKTATSPFSDASVASGTLMSDMIRLQGGNSLLPPQYRIISGVCTQRIQPSDGVGTRGNISKMIAPLDDLKNRRTEMTVEPTLNVPQKDLNDGNSKSALLSTVGARANITCGEISHYGSANTLAPLNDLTIRNNPRTETNVEPNRNTVYNEHDCEDAKPPLLPSPHPNRANAVLPVDEVENPQTQMNAEPTRTDFSDDYDHGAAKSPLTLTGISRSGITVREMLQSSHLSSTNTMNPFRSDHDKDDDINPPPSLSADARHSMTVRELLRHKKRCELQERLREQEKALEELRRKRMEQIERRKADPNLNDLY